MKSLLESLNLALLNESKDYSVKTIKIDDTIQFLKFNPEYYFYTRGIGDNKVAIKAKDTILDCEISYKDSKWIVNTYSEHYNGGFQMKDDSSIKTIEDLVEALDSYKDRDVKINDKEGYGIPGTYDYDGIDDTGYFVKKKTKRKEKIQLRKKK